MEKMYLKNGREVHFGDVLVYKSKMKGNKKEEEVSIKNIITLTEDTLPELLTLGIVVIKSDVSPTDIPLSLSYYVQKIADKMGWKLEKTYNYINNIDSIYPAAAYSMVLREIAIELDKKYKDHIEKSSNIYVISMFNGKIVKANKAHIKNYKNFAAFRTIEDAKTACNITRDILKDMFKYNG